MMDDSHARAQHLDWTSVHACSMRARVTCAPPLPHVGYHVTLPPMVCLPFLTARAALPIRPDRYLHLPLSLADKDSMLAAMTELSRQHAETNSAWAEVTAKQTKIIDFLETRLAFLTRGNGSPPPSTLAR